MRAATPTAAAELISPDQSQLQRLRQQLLTHIARSLEPKTQRLDYARRLLDAHSPQTRLSQHRARLEHAGLALPGSVLRALARQRSNLTNLAQRLQPHDPRRNALPLALARIEQNQARVLRARLALKQASRNQLGMLAQRLQAAGASLQTLSPQRTLERGYVIVRGGAGAGEPAALLTSKLQLDAHTAQRNPVEPK